MAGNVYVWSDPNRNAISYHVIDEGGITQESNIGDVNDISKAVNKFKKLNYRIHIDQNWLGANLPIHESSRSKLLIKIGMGEPQTA